MVGPDIKETEARLWEGKKITTIIATFEEFINQIEKEYENVIFSEMSKQHTYTLCFAKDYLRMFNPIMLEVLPVNLEEIFIYEMERKGYGVYD